MNEQTGATSAPPGVVFGTVEDTADPEHWGRIRVKYQWLEGYTVSHWAPIASLMAGPDYGTWFIPEVGNECVLAFERGDVSQPVVLGFLWNGVDKPPSTSTKERMIRTVNGHTIRFLDPTPTSGGNKGGIAIEDGHGNAIVLTNTQITIRSNGVLSLDAATVRIGTRVVAPMGGPI